MEIKEVDCPVCKDKFGVARHHCAHCQGTHKIKEVTKNTSPVNPSKSYTDFGALDAGDMFINECFKTKSLMIKLHVDTIEKFSPFYKANAIFIEDGTGWNFDDGERVTIVKLVTLED